MNISNRDKRRTYVHDEHKLQFFVQNVCLNEKKKM